MDPRRRSLAILAAFWAAGMILAHAPMLFSGLGRVQGNLGDPRLLHYVLEHEYRWVRGEPNHRDFWDPPIFHPAKNTGAYTENLIGVAPLYMVLRGVGVPLDPAFPVWLLLLSTLNFAAMALLLRSGLGRSEAASGFGALLFSFASARIAQIGLPQLLPGFYLALAVYALLRLFREGDRVRGLRWAGLFALALAGQIYTSFYIGWFLVLSLGLALFWSFALPATRAAAVGGLRLHGSALAGALIVAGVALTPFLTHSLRAAQDVGFRDYDQAEIYLPRLSSWLYFGPEHRLYGAFSGWWPFDRIPAPVSPHAVGFGLLTPVLAVLGLRDTRASIHGKLLIAVSLSLFVLTLTIGGASVWALLFITTPGANAIRVVARVSLLLLLPASAGAAAFVDASRWKRPLLIAAVGFCILEQARSTPSFDRRETHDRVVSIARRVQGRTPFFYTASEVPPGTPYLDSLPHRFHVDAMMASLEADAPTLNGYSGWVPPGWPLELSSLAVTPEAEPLIESQLREWCGKQGLDRSAVQWIRGPR